MPMSSSRLFFGADYNPDQWSLATIAEDVRLMRQAHVNAVSLGIFAWSQLEPEDGRFDFTWMDAAIEQLHAAGIAVFLSTPSGAAPRWLALAQPEVRGVDRRGVRRPYGGRQSFCPTSPLYRHHVARVDGTLAERYAHHPAVRLWHVSNEVWAHCHCTLCAVGFRDFLRRRYDTIERLNERWWTCFWSHRYDAFDQIEPPFDPSEMHSGQALQGLELDWRRFMSRQMAEFLGMEVATVKAVNSAIPTTTNLEGLTAAHDLARLSDEMDIVSWDSYPPNDAPPEWLGLMHAYFRSLKDQAPFLLIEQTCGGTNWQAHHAVKPPGLDRARSWQAIGHGSQSAMYFQWRASLGGQEKFHASFIEHHGRTDTRMFHELTALGEEMERVGPRVARSAPVKARVGLLFDHESRWALELSHGPGQDKDWTTVWHWHYRAWWQRNIPCDVVRTDGDWTGYDVLVCPKLYLLRSGTFPVAGTPAEDRGRIDVVARLRAFVAEGGTLIGTTLTGLVDETDHLFTGGTPGGLTEVFGLWVEEIDNQPRGAAPQPLVPEPGADFIAAGTGDRYFEVLRPEGAEVIARYGAGWLSGTPCITRNRHGRGQAWYLGSDVDGTFLDRFCTYLSGQLGLAALLPPVPGVEVIRRRAADEDLLIVVNHTASSVIQPLPGTWHELLSGSACDQRLSLPALGVAVLVGTKAG